MTEAQKTFILESAIVRLKAGDSREQVRATLAVPPTTSPQVIDDLLNEAVIEEARRHNAALPAPDFSGYSPAPIDFHPEDKITITCKYGEWSASPADVEFLDRERHMLPMPGSKVIHSKNGIITSELLPETWEGVKEWQERRRKRVKP